MLQEYIERKSPIDDIQSSHNELLKSLQYGHEDERGYLFSDLALRSAYLYWTSEQENPLRSSRSKEVGQKIANRALFELAYRKGEVRNLETIYELPAAPIE